eukprot:1162088-Pelagomonas_calceolata.AAC.5
MPALSSVSMHTNIHYSRRAAERKSNSVGQACLYPYLTRILTKVHVAGVEIKVPSIGGSQWEALSLMHAAKRQA